jgi:hypothetical protein
MKQAHKGRKNTKKGLINMKEYKERRYLKKEEREVGRTPI